MQLKHQFNEQLNCLWEYLSDIHAFSGLNNNLADTPFYKLS